MFVNFKKNKECHVYGPVCNSIVQRTPNKDYWRKCLVMICTMIFNPHKLLNNPQWFFVIKLVQNMDNGHVIRTFLNIFQIIGWLGQINCGLFEVFPVEILAFCHCVSLVHDFPLINTYFYKNYLKSF